MEKLLNENPHWNSFSYRASVKRPFDETKHSMKSCMSDPIGLEYELSSGGPLVEGMTERQNNDFPDSLPVQNWQPANQHMRLQTMPAFKGNSDEKGHCEPHVQEMLLSSSSARSDSSDQALTSFIDTESDQKHHAIGQKFPAVRNIQNRHPYENVDGATRFFTMEESLRQSMQDVELSRDQNFIPDQAPVKGIFDEVSEQHATEERIDLFLARRTNRSHTSEGIPAHKVREFLNQKYGEVNEMNQIPYHQTLEEVQSLREEVKFYKELTRCLEDQNKMLTSHLNEERKKVEQNVMGASTPPLTVTISPTPQMWSQHMPGWQTLPELSPTTNTTVPTPQSISAASPDPFSPFDQLSPISQQIYQFKNGIHDPNIASRQMIESIHQASYHTTEGVSEALKNVEFYPQSSTQDSTKSFIPSPLDGGNNLIQEIHQSYLNGLKMNLNEVEKEFELGPANERGSVESVSDPMARFDGLPFSQFAPNLHGPLPFTFNSPFLAGNNPSCQTPSQREMSIAHSERNPRNGSDNHAPPDILIAKALSARSQEASIQLQQQLKNGHPNRKVAIINGIAPHLVKLAEDKHGNFLVQRAITVEPKLAWHLQGQFVNLALSQFGCHVVQKLLDDEDEEIRKIVVEELLMDQANDTLTCRNSIHIWQKVLEVTWKDAEMRVKIIRSINERMQGRWADMAMMETGSIICQNLFESGNGEEKRDCLNEILERLSECALNQWGVWVVQHIIEHGDAEDKRRAFDELSKDAYQLTLSQYGQKAIMSALKSKDPEFIQSYINILCERDNAQKKEASGSHSNERASNRRSILVDIATSSQGVQIMTQLLTSVTNDQRERIIKTVRKNSVFLKGSKPGLRVHQLCERARAFTGY